MAITARTLASKLSLGLQSRVFSIPWVKTNKSMLCMKGRECSSSVPVRYIPNKVARTKEPKNSQSLKGFQENDEIDESWNGVERRSIILSEEKSGSRKPMTEKNFMFDDAKKDGSAWLGKEIYQNFVTVDLELIDELEEVDEEIESYQGKAKQKILLQCKTMKDAEKLAVGLLATRAFTAFELRKKLLGKKFPPVTVEAVINDFQSRGLLNDSLYAETFAQSRFSSSSWGPRRIKQALFKKGVGEVDSERALKFVFKDGESNEDHESNLGLSKQSMDHLFVQASNQWLRGQDVPNEKRKSRIIRWLQYRGFSWGVIGSIMKKLESQYEVDSERAGKFVFKDGKSNEAQESNLGLSKQSMDDLFVQASKQWLRGQDVPKEKRKSRIIRWLQYRGFSWGVIGSILKKLESQYPP